jgi:hypothetical protein
MSTLVVKNRTILQHGKNGRIKLNHITLATLENEDKKDSVPYIQTVAPDNLQAEATR